MEVTDPWWTSEDRCDQVGEGLTFTLEALPDQAPQHLPTVVAEGRGLVGVHVEGMRADLEVLYRGQSWSRGGVVSQLHR